MEQLTLNNRYQVQRQLSKKGPRQTLLAIDLTTQQQVIIKLLLFGDEIQWVDHRLFERGAGTLKTLDHPSIPAYLDYFDVEMDQAKGFAQVQSYIPAKSLQEQVDGGRTFSEVEIRQLAQDLLEILQYLQSRKPAITHRDIKPSNILLGDRTGNHVGQVYLVDFDSVQIAAAKSDHTMTIVGTYGYMPPEQFGGQAGPASDLYGLGATLIYMATGQSPAELPQKDMRIEFESAVSLSPDLVNWLKWMTEPSLDRRLSSAQKALQALERPEQRLGSASESAAESIGVGSGAIAKPNNSKIMVRQTPDVLEIIIPPKGLKGPSSFLFITLFIFGIPVAFLSLIFFWVSVEYLFNNFLEGIVALIITLFPTAISLALMGPFLYCLFHEKRLHIGTQKISLVNKTILPIKRAVPRKALWRISSDAKRLKVILVTQNKRFELPTTSLQELDWLGQTLSLWLEMPVAQD